MTACERDIILMNDCVIYAANKKVVEDAKHSLDTTYRSNVLLVETKDAAVGHAFLVFAVGQTLFAYDASGSRVVDLPVEKFEEYPSGIAIQLVGNNLKVAKFAFNK